MRCTTLALLAATLLPVLAIAPAMAGDCYEGIGCPSTQYFSKPALKELGCQPLWEVRNRIYKDRGYCFKTAAAITAFGNTGCTITNQASVPLNAFERANVGLIRSVEKAKGCHFGG
jgi:YARHG domain